MRRGYWFPGARKQVVDKTLYNERFNPNEPFIEIVPFTPRERLIRQHKRRRWKARVTQKRCRAGLGFTSLSKMRRHWRRQ